ncbi:hypothetical protein A9D60_20085 [Leisingera sp. JC1]|nr:hypothetical protein A9D60_20085 [Leisingera sp. JC1]
MTFEEKFLELTEIFFELRDLSGDETDAKVDQYFMVDGRVGELKEGLRSLAKGDPKDLQDICDFFSDDNVFEFLARDNAAVLPKLLSLAGNITADTWRALLQKGVLRRDFPFPLQVQATRTISAVPRALKRLMSATRMWISAVWLSGSLAAMRSPKALRQRILASARLRVWYPVHRFQNA